MKNSDLPLIDVAQLRIGMFIHLDIGWMAHPFPLSSFKLTSADQIATIRKLGVPQVRWAPEKSDPDPAEVAAYQRVFGERLATIPVSSVKGALGHCLCGAGGIEAAITALAVARQMVPPTAGFAEPDPACPIDPVPGAGRAWPIGVALSSSFAFGGNSAALVLGKVP